MRRPATPNNINALLDRLERLPRLGAPLRRDPGIRSRLRLRAHLSREKYATPWGELELLLRAELHDLL